MSDYHSYKSTLESNAHSSYSLLASANSAGSLYFAMPVATPDHPDGLLNFSRHSMLTLGLGGG
jgi:hypothetical protein